MGHLVPAANGLLLRYRNKKMGDLIKSSEASLVLSPTLFLFRDILKGIHTIVAICHQFVPLNVQVIQEIFLMELYLHIRIINPTYF